MGGYAYALRLANKKPDKVIGAAGIELWTWFRGQFAKRATDPLGKRILEYVDMYTPSSGNHDFSTWPTVRYERGDLTISLGDAGGLAYIACLATVHALMFTTERHPAAVDAILARHGLTRAAKQPDDPEIRNAQFFLFKNAIATFQLEPGVEVVSRDSDGTDDGDEVHVSELAPADQRKIRALLKSGACLCPVHRS